MKTDTLFFTIGKSKYKIGSKLFPVNQVSKLKIFSHSNTEPILSEELSDYLDKVEFETGRCYTNTEFLVEAGKRFNLPLEFYAGWLFIGFTRPPIHHAWAVLNGNVIDIGLKPPEIEIMRGVDTSKPNWRAELAPKLVALSKQKIKSSERYVFGRVPEEALYAGCPDDKFNAIRIYNNLTDKFPNHPSYIYDGNTIEGRSKLQEEIVRHGGR